MRGFRPGQTSGCVVLTDHADAKTIDATPAWRQNLDRMNRDYVAPRPADPQWADVVVLTTPPESCAEIESYCALLPSIGSMRGKIAAPLAARDEESVLKPSTRRLPAPG